MVAEGKGRIVSLDAVVEEADWPKRTDDSFAATLQRRRSDRDKEARALLSGLAKVLRLLLMKYDPN